jgi:hypothetical protein
VVVAAATVGGIDEARARDWRPRCGLWCRGPAPRARVRPPPSLIVPYQRTAHRLGQRRGQRAQQAFSRQPVSPLSAVALPLRLPLRLPVGLPPSHSFGNTFRDLFLLRRPDLAQVDSLGRELLKDAVNEVLVDVGRVEFRRAQQRAQAGLVLDGAPRRRPWRPPGVPAPAAARLSATVAGPMRPRRLEGAAGNSGLTQTQGLHLSQQTLFVVVGIAPPPQLRQHIVAGAVLGAIRVFLVIALAARRVRAHVVVEERRDKGVGLRGAHRGAAGRARVRVDGRGRRGLEGEPLLQAGAAEGVQAVEQGERLVEQVGADLAAQSAGARITRAGATTHSPSTSVPSPCRSARQRPLPRPLCRARCISRQVRMFGCRLAWFR